MVPSVSPAGQTGTADPDRPGHGAAAAGRRSAALPFEVVFLGYLACTAADGRAFAHLHLTVHGVPLFVGELTLLALTLLALAARGPRRVLPRRLDFASAGLLVILALGAVLAARGLALGFGIAALRDFALVYYAWFFFLTRAYLEEGGTSGRIVGALLAGSVAGSLLTTTRFLAAPALVWGHGTAGHTALYAWIAIIIVLAGWSAARGAAIRVAASAAIIVCTFVIYLSGYRTLLPVVAGAVGVVTLLAARRAPAAPRRFAALLWIWAAAFGAVIVVPFAAIPQTGRFVSENGRVPIGDGLATVAYRWASDRYGLQLGVPASKQPEDLGALVDETGSLDFRTNAWRHALKRIRGAPWTGIGFGAPALLHPKSNCDTAPSPTSNCGSAHNTYLTLAMRMGIPAALLVGAVLAWLLAGSARAILWPGRAPPADSALVIAALAFMSFLVFGATSLLFESPYLSSVVWVLAGAIAHLTAGVSGREPLR